LQRAGAYRPKTNKAEEEEDRRGVLSLIKSAGKGGGADRWRGMRIG
jgi:hypothetical protein